ncbi:malto-oligosyltrehalose trehalohydrolase [Corynebacterium cystitidis]|uniref:Malto-oligosyltrehalose trehalohydrolase n=1 Tax=Corynebacterium cystitidis DSM 20524 TaxID=1121357 RepID=A0A1H9NU71_9CORY|nr:malto-oligosyltrehalose trehalohydrolase [Corynebacterium cystitidis]WJY82749.1 Malto-oligosyltrehalose trehalohydrolase [Corynebacterium cystitidis DSM 20524]SER38883.1 maltooligosyltrehalose trehalohydrolase [Corynebacterium cystitidis DSM 20524]SNV71014.1 1,4-alpha-glucan branching enzyme [Corynebacterium cystitidis]
MTSFQPYSVWAPFAHDVRLKLNGSTVEMHRVTDPCTNRSSWWTCDIVARPGDRYGFEVHDGEHWSITLPDPRTKSQPDGVHGLSEVLDPGFEWTDQDWTGRVLPGQVIYELHVGTFTPEGTFAGVVDQLDYLKALGVTTIELMPVQPFGGERNWGYDGVEWFAVQESYGGARGLKELVNAAHNKGIGVILDVVYNHFGPDGNYNGFFGPYTAGGSTGWGEVVNISTPGSDEVRRYILDTVLQWLDEFHIDGLRLDAVHSLDDRGAYSILEQIQDIADQVEARTGIPRPIIAESDLNDPRVITPKASGGYGLAGQWVDDIHHALHTVVSGEQHAYYEDFGSIELLADTLRHGFRFRNSWSGFRGRTHGRAIDLSTTSPARLVTYTTTHDQTGNRAKGDRPSQNLTPAQQVLKAAVIYFSPFTPMLFMGEEFGAQTPFPFFCSHTDDELNRLTREGRFREFARSGWDASDVPDPAAEETFESAKLDWDFTSEQEKIHAAYTRLLELRRELGLSRSDLRELQVDHGNTWLTMGYDDVVLAVNLGEEPAVVPVGGQLIYSFTQPDVRDDETHLGGWEFAIIRR